MRGKLANPSDANSIKGEPFYHIENLQQEDLFKFAFFKRFRKQMSEMLFHASGSDPRTLRSIVHNLSKPEG